MPTAAKKPVAKKPAAKKPAVRKHVVKKPVAGDVIVAPKPKTAVHHDYTFAVGRRKEAVARVRMFKHGAGEITVNNRALGDYFPGQELQNTVRGPLIVTHQEAVGSFTIKVAGGGTQGQADAVRLGIARALVKIDADVRIPLKRAGFLHRDPRVKERKKYGLRRARRAPQWQKR